MELLHKYGYSLVFIIVLLEQLGLPTPALPILMLGGAMAAAHDLSLSVLILIASGAAFFGDFVWYEIGKRKGRGILKLLCRLSLSPENCVRQTENSFAKRGINSLIYAKFVPGLNTIAPPMAGIVRASFPSFFWRDVAGIVLYVAACVAPGFIFEKRVFDITDWFEQFGRVFFYVLAAGLAVYILYKYVRLRIIQKTLAAARITPEELHRRMSAGEKFTILDLRSNLDGDESMLPGAFRMAPHDIDANLHRLDRELPIVMYCT